MKMGWHLLWRVVALCSSLLWAGTAGAETFRVVTYNVENYVIHPSENRQAKSAAAKAKVRESILACRPDVLALQEIAGEGALHELCAALRAEGLDFPYGEHVTGYDTNVQVAVLSRFPLIARRPHTNDSFLLGGRRFRVGRGFAEVDVRVNTNYVFTLLTAHLKSKRVVPEADEAELRLEEAKILREKVEARLRLDAQANVVVLGDFNDTRDAASTKAIIGRGKLKLVDTRPAERNGDTAPNPDPAWEPRNITWTHYYAKEDSYDRIDYILLSPAMRRRWVTNATFIPTIPNWGVGSDHRPLVVTFETADR